MDRDALVLSAEELVLPSAAAAAEFDAKQHAMAEALTAQMLARPDVDRLIGEDNREMMATNSRNFLRFMNSIFRHYDSAVFVQTVAWVFRTYRQHGFHVSYWPANIDAAVEIMRQELTPETFIAVHPFFDWLLNNIPSFTDNSDEDMEGEHCL